MGDSINFASGAAGEGRSGTAAFKAVFAMNKMTFMSGINPDGNGPEPEREEAAMRAVLANWVEQFERGEASFASKAVFVEHRLRQALACSATLGTPNTCRCALVCDAWDRVAPLTGRFEGMLQLLWSELLRCIFADYTDGLMGSGAKAYAARTPYFVEVQRLRQQEENSQDTIR
jgi:hypothetical protein